MVSGLEVVGPPVTWLDPALSLALSHDTGPPPTLQGFSKVQAPGPHPGHLQAPQAQGLQGQSRTDRQTHTQLGTVEVSSSFIPDVPYKTARSREQAGGLAWP